MVKKTRKGCLIKKDGKYHRDCTCDACYYAFVAFNYITDDILPQCDTSRVKTRDNIIEPMKDV